MFYLLIASESTANIYNVPRQVTKKSTKQFNFPRVFPWFSHGFHRHLPQRASAVKAPSKHNESRPRRCERERRVRRRRLLSVLEMPPRTSMGSDGYLKR